MAIRIRSGSIRQAHVAYFFVRTLAVCALAKAIFGLFPAAELQKRLALRDNPHRLRIKRLDREGRQPHEVRYGSAGDEGSAPPVRAGNVLDRPSRRPDLRRHGWRDRTGGLAVLRWSAAAYSGAAVLLAALHGSPPPVRAAEASASPLLTLDFVVA